MERSAGRWRHGAVRLETGAWRFRVWAPRAERVELRLFEPTDPTAGRWRPWLADGGGRLEKLEAQDGGYYEGIVEDASAGVRYFWQVDGQDLPDPASRFQPEGVHGPSETVDPEFDWEDADWEGLALERFVLYEVHVGTFTHEGNFEAIIPQLDYLRDLGVTAIELMPVAQFPGARNWGYDGVQPFAAQNTYGGVVGLKRLVNACHQRGLAVVLDVVYNHLGAEGNYLERFGPYFTEKYKTPWGAAVNFDGPQSDEVRRFFVESALHWVAECHVDTLRVDAVHAIHDESASPFLAELGEAVHLEGARLKRRVQVIAESDLNDTRMVRAPEAGGMGMDGQWSDDFHHALHALVTGERRGYYGDFGHVEDLVKAYREGFVYSGQYSAYRRRRHGNSSKEIAARQFVVFAQNHDQVGNRMQGERLSALASYEQLKLAAGAVLLSPFVPLLFMGEEYGERAPFLYFVSHGDAGFIEAVRAGRRKGFAAFGWRGAPADPQDEATFVRSKLDHRLKQEAGNQRLLDFYRALMRLRREVAALACLSKEQMEVEMFAAERVVILRRWANHPIDEEEAMPRQAAKTASWGPRPMGTPASSEEAMVLLCFAGCAVTVQPRTAEGSWRKLVDSSDTEWMGPGGGPGDWTAGGGGLQLNPSSVVVYRRVAEE